MLEDLRRLGELPREAAKIAAPLVERELRAKAAAGEDPEGTAWAPRKKDGGRAMKNAAAHIEVAPVGTVVRATLTGPDVYHHFGAGPGHVTRQVLPDPGTIPPGVEKALREAADKAFGGATK